jgi:hypothetical protein
LVTSSAFIVAFPPEPKGDTGWRALTVANDFGGYFWHIKIRATPQWLAAALEVSPDQDLQIPAFPNLASVVAAGQLRSCRLESHVIACAYPVRGSARTEGNRVVVAVTELAWLQMIWRQRPTIVHLARGQQNTTYQWMDSIVVEYH